MKRSPAVVALGVIRLGNGLLALFAPGTVLGRLGGGPAPRSPATYVLRMFGIRTVFLGLDLLAGDEAGTRAALRRAPLIHATDALAALAAGLSRQLPPRAALLTVSISSLNLGLAIAASRAQAR